MTDARTCEYVVDLTNHSNRLRLESAVPGRPMKVVVRDPAHPDGPAIHGTGLLSADGRTIRLLRVAPLDADGEAGTTDG